MEAKVVVKPNISPDPNEFCSVIPCWRIQGRVEWACLDHSGLVKALTTPEHNPFDERPK